MIHHTATGKERPGGDWGVATLLARNGRAVELDSYASGRISILVN